LRVAEQARRGRATRKGSIEREDAAPVASARVDDVRAAPKFLAVDFFCGAGGTTRGLIDAGGYVIAGIDKDPLQLSMAFLAEGEGTKPDEAVLTALLGMAADYMLWIDEIERSLSPDLSANFRVAARENLANCRRCHDRMLDGIGTLRADPQALLAFRLMNRAMLVQQFHSSLDDRHLDSPRIDPPKDYRDLPRGKGNWRPFQLAFVLMSVAGMADPDHPERGLVDLIWFPTGGGKTEAYLGLTAFTVCLERLRGATAGVAVIIRFRSGGNAYGWPSSLHSEWRLRGDTGRLGPTGRARTTRRHRALGGSQRGDLFLRSVVHREQRSGPVQPQRLSLPRVRSSPGDQLRREQPSPRPRARRGHTRQPRHRFPERLSCSLKPVRFHTVLRASRCRHRGRRY
jgi:hypothetical protein